MRNSKGDSIGPRPFYVIGRWWRALKLRFFPFLSGDRRRA